MENSVVRPLETGDLAEITRVHVAAFPESMLTKLGPDVVEKYYHWLLTGPHEGKALGYFESGALRGFCFGGRFPDSLGGFLRQHPVRISLHVAMRPWLLLEPTFWERLSLARTVVRRSLRRQKRGPARQTEGSGGGGRPYGILAIATDPSFQGHGVGRRLMREHEKIAFDLGFQSMRLTVARDNLRAIAFYQRLGWAKTVSGPEWNGTMRKTLTRETVA